jgi:hypothetical protein
MDQSGTGRQVKGPPVYFTQFTINIKEGHPHFMFKLQVEVEDWHHKWEED